MVAPWTAGPRSERDLEVGSRVDDDLDDDPVSESGGGRATVLDIGAGSFTSYLDATPPRFTRSRRASAGSGARRRTRARRRPRRLALPLLALLVVVSLALTGAIVDLASRALSAMTPSESPASPLVVPAPAMAGGLPRHTQPMTSGVTRALITEFTDRFKGITRGTGDPSGLYREPGTIDPVTDQPGWVMYLGFNSAENLGTPSATVEGVMANLVDNSAPNAYWVAAPGARGGSARCAIALFGSTTVSLCAWATEYTIGALLSPTADTRGDELAVLMPLMRLDLQQG